MPAPIAENPGPSPFAGATWIACHWQWSGARWQWKAGGRRDTTVFGSSGGVGAAISVGTSIGTPLTNPVSDRDHRTNPPPVPDRDHRTSTPPAATTTNPRDHRT